MGGITMVTEALATSAVANAADLTAIHFNAGDGCTHNAFLSFKVEVLIILLNPHLHCRHLYRISSPNMNRICL